MESTITLYYAPFTSATRVFWALEELGVSFEKAKVDLSTGAQRKPEYLALNPNGKVPCLVVDGVPMFESGAMLIYLGERFGVAKGFWPAPDSKDRPRALAWVLWSAATMGAAVQRLINNTSERVPAEARNAQQADAARAELQGLFRILEEQLAHGDYLLGESFTFADLANATLITFVTRFGVDLGPYARLSSWISRCTQRPALGRATAA